MKGGTKKQKKRPKKIAKNKNKMAEVGANVSKHHQVNDQNTAFVQQIGKVHLNHDSSICTAYSMAYTDWK